MSVGRIYLVKITLCDKCQCCYPEGRAMLHRLALLTLLTHGTVSMSTPEVPDGGSKPHVRHSPPLISTCATFCIP